MIAGEGLPVSAVHVLVVEDDPSERGLLQTLLAAEGYDGATAGEGLGSLVEMAAPPPALVLLDLVMPDLGGVRVLEEPTADPDLSGIAAIVVTGEDEHVPRVREGLGDDDVVLQSFAVEELLTRVGAVTGGPVR